LLKAVALEPDMQLVADFYNRGLLPVGTFRFERQATPWTTTMKNPSVCQHCSPYSETSTAPNALDTSIEQSVCRRGKYIHRALQKGARLWFHHLAWPWWEVAQTAKRKTFWPGPAATLGSEASVELGDFLLDDGP